MQVGKYEKFQEKLLQFFFNICVFLKNTHYIRLLFGLKKNSESSMFQSLEYTFEQKTDFCEIVCIREGITLLASYFLNFFHSTQVFFIYIVVYCIVPFLISKWGRGFFILKLPSCFTAGQLESKTGKYHKNHQKNDQ